MALQFPASPTTGTTYTSNNQTWTWNGVGWSTGYNNSGFVRQAFSATAGQTTFYVVGGYLPGFLDVYQNGVKLVNGTDVVISSGTNIVLATGATVGDTIEAIGMASAAYLAYLPLAGGTVSGNISITSPNTLQINGKQAVNGPLFSVYLSANQTISNNTWTKVRLNTETLDTNSAFDNATNFRFLPTVEGYYQFNGLVMINAQTVAYSALYKNGVRIVNGMSIDFSGVGTAATDYQASAVSGIVYLNGSSDYVELWGLGSSGVTAFVGTATVSTSNWGPCMLSGAMIRGA